MLPSVLDEKQTQYFRKCLTETIAWCSAYGSPDDPEHSLRRCEPSGRYLAARDSQVFSLALERGTRLSKAGLTAPLPSTDLRGGRLLAFDSDGTLSGGAARVASLGYFDEDNVPPCDTWVWYVYEPVYAERIIAVSGQPWRPFESYLITWVPPQFIVLAEAGLSVIPDGCAVWLDELESPFARAIQNKQLY